MTSVAGYELVFVVPGPVVTGLVVGQAGLGEGGELAQSPVRLGRALGRLRLRATAQPRKGVAMIRNDV